MKPLTLSFHGMTTQLELKPILGEEIYFLNIVKKKGI